MKTDALLVGLARALTKLMASLVQQDALDREITISDFENYLDHLDDDVHDRATRMWIGHMIGVLEADPTRPPPAPVLRLVRSDDPETDS